MDRLAVAALFLMVAGACKEPAAEGPALTLSVDALDFGEVPVDSEQTLQFTVENSGDGSFDILSGSVVEGSSTIWSVSRSGAETLEAGDKAMFTVAFAPREQGPEVGRVQVRTTFEDSSSIYVRLDGVGTAAIVDNDGDGWSPSEGDCDDGDDQTYPGATEVCDGKDNDCDGNLPAKEEDADYDGYRGCGTNEDCDDDDDAVYPGAPEICDGKDSDCDGDIEDDEDEDQDGFTICDGDCDDDQDLSFPGNVEVCDYIDNDCTGEIDDIDEDNDGHSPCTIGGDCDDGDDTSYPLIVDGDALDGGDGTWEAPYASIEEAIEFLPEQCRTLVLAEGSYEVNLGWDEGDLRLVGTGELPDDTSLSPPEASSGRIFDVSGGAHLAMGNVLLTGGYATGDGGVLRAVGADISLERVVLVGNRATGDGGAVSVSSGTLTMEDCEATSNVAEDDGGAIAVLSGGFVDVGSTFSANEGVRGGAALVESSVVSAEQTWFEDNYASDTGGGLTVVGGSSVWITGNTYWLNAAAVSGGALSISDLNAPSSVVRNNLFGDNVSGLEAGAVDIGGTVGAFVFANNTVVGNGTDDNGAGIFVDVADGSGLTIWANILGWNDGLDGLYVLDGNGASVGYNLVYATTSGTDFAIGSGEDAGTNLPDTSNPGFVEFTNDGDPSTDDLAFEASSPAIDAGPEDGEGPGGYTTWADPDGSRNDLGHLGGPGAL